MASIIKVDTIQDQDGNNIISEAANTITIGASGDTITIPSGATLDTSNSTVTLPDGSVTSAKLSYPLTTFSSTGIDDNATSTAITIDSSQNIGIGTASPDSILDLTSIANNSLIHFNVTDGGSNGDIIGGFEVNNTGGTIGKLTVNRETTNSSGYMAFQTGTTEKMRIQNNGNVGIGTSSPNGILELKSTGNTNFFITAGNTSASQVVLGDTDDIDVGKIAYSHNVNSMEFIVNASERMRIISNGSVGIGTTSPDAPLDIRATNSSIRLGNASQYFRIQHNDSANALVFNDNDVSERMRIDSTGNLLVGTTSAVNTATRAGFFNDTSANFVVSVYNANNTSGDSVFNTLIGSNCNNTSSFHILCGVNGVANVFYVYGNGNVVNTNNSYGAISDIKLKENITNASSQWDDIKSLKIRKYSLKSDNLDTPNMLGVIAQELETAGMGGLVFEVPDRDKNNNELETTTKNVNYSILYMKAVKALQEAMERIETLEAKVQTLETNQP